MKKFVLSILFVMLCLTGCTGGKTGELYEDRHLSRRGTIHITEESAPVFAKESDSSSERKDEFLLELQEEKSDLNNNVSPAIVTVKIEGTPRNYILNVQYPDNRKDLHYPLPGEILKTISLDSVWSSTGFPIYLKTQNKNNLIKYYKIDLTEETISEYRPVALWDRIFNPKWIYTGSENQNYITDEAGKALIVINHDGEISGHHSHSYLNAIHKRTGKEIWSVYAGYLNAQYAFNKNISKVFVGVNLADFSTHKLYCINHKNGKQLWEKEFSGEDRIFNIASVKNNVVVCLQNEDRYQIISYREADGKELWQRDIGSDRLYADTRNMNHVILTNEKGMTAYDVRSLKQKWYLEQELFTDKNIYNNYTGDVSVLDPILYAKQTKSNLKWFSTPKGFIQVNLDNGKIIKNISDTDNRLLLWDKDHVVVVNNAHAVNLPSNAFYVYNLKTGKTVFTANGNFQGGVLDHNQFIYLNGEFIMCSDMKSGNQLWKTPFKASFDPFDNSGILKPVVYKNLLIIPQIDHLLVFNKTTGELLYQVIDYRLPVSPFPDHMAYKVYSDGRHLFVSRMNRTLEALR